jgi:hypothetical protein
LTRKRHLTIIDCQRVDITMVSLLADQVNLMFKRLLDETVRSLEEKQHDSGEVCDPRGGAGCEGKGRRRHGSRADHGAESNL